MGWQWGFEARVVVWTTHEHTYKLSMLVAVAVMHVFMFVSVRVCVVGVLLCCLSGCVVEDNEMAQHRMTSSTREILGSQLGVTGDDTTCM